MLFRSVWSPDGPQIPQLSTRRADVVIAAEQTPPYSEMEFVHAITSMVYATMRRIQICPTAAHDDGQLIVSIGQHAAPARANFSSQVKSVARGRATTSH